MPTEIEVKYLVNKMPPLNSEIKSEKIVQGYLQRGDSSGEKATVRVRQLGNIGFLTIKGKKNGLTQPEYEYQIPIEDALELLKMCEHGLLEKTRYYIPHGQHIIELDVFGGKNTGLIVAEIELSYDGEIFEKPEWFGENVSEDINYSNAFLSKIK